MCNVIVDVKPIQACIPVLLYIPVTIDMTSSVRFVYSQDSKTMILAQLVYVLNALNMLHLLAIYVNAMMDLSKTSFSRYVKMTQHQP